LETKRFSIDKTQASIPAITEEYNEIEHLSEVTAETEFPAFEENNENTPQSKNTGKKNIKRIDILLDTDDCVVCIEFKINHDLDNPLEIYQDHIERLREDKKHRYYVVLTPFKKRPSDEVREFANTKKNKFKQIILSHFVKKVLERLPENYFIDKADNIYTQYLIDFIQSIQNREIRFKRSEILLDLKSKIKKESTFHDKHGKFIQFRYKNSSIKTRIENGDFKIEKWSSNNEFGKTLQSLPLSIFNYNRTVDFLNSL
jgi:hypothetical protein